MSTFDPIAHLAHPQVVRAIRGSLKRFGVAHQDLDDGVADVQVRAIASLRRTLDQPTALEGLQSFVAKIARQLAIDEARKRDVHERSDQGLCEKPQKFPETRRVAVMHPIDVRRQLELIADLFREGRMPEDGVAIFEGLMDGLTLVEIAEELGLTERVVEWRLLTMRRLIAARLATEGLSESTARDMRESTALRDTFFEALRRAA